MEVLNIDQKKVKNVMKIVDKMLEKADASSSRYHILLFIKSYSYYLMENNEESLHICNSLLDHCQKVNYNKSIVCQALNLKTMIYMRNSEFSNMYDSIQRSLSVDQTNKETQKLFSMFKEKLVC